jgi:hypothetical protein
MFMAHQQNAEQEHIIITVNQTFENVAKFEYLGPT